MLEFDIKLHHIPGAKIVQSDTFSQRPDFTPITDNDNEDLIVLPNKLFINLINLDLQKRILNCNAFDSDATEALKVLLEGDSKTIRSELEDWTLEKVDNKKTLFYKGKNYVPQDSSLRRDIVRTFHDHETAGHPGELETYNSIRQHYWWPGLRTFVKNYVKGCGVCQQFKIDRNLSKPAFVPTEGAKTTRPFAYCSMDFITDLPHPTGLTQSW